MKYEVVERIEAIAKKRPNESQVKALIEEGILSKSLVRNIDFELYQFHGDDWVSPLYHQIDMLADFIKTSISMRLGIPDISGDSLVAKAAYNVAKATVGGIPTRYATSQEFFRLLMEEFE